MNFWNFLDTKINDKLPIDKIKEDFIHYKNALNLTGKEDIIYNNLFDNIIWILKTKFGRFICLYSDTTIFYNELSLIISSQIPQFLFLQKKQLLESLDTFADINNWGSTMKEAIKRDLKINEDMDSSSGYIPIDSDTLDPYSKDTNAKTSLKDDKTDINRNTVDFLYFFSRMKWNTASIELSDILKPYYSLFVLYETLEEEVYAKSEIQELREELEKFKITFGDFRKDVVSMFGETENDIQNNERAINNLATVQETNSTNIVNLNNTKADKSTTYTKTYCDNTYGTKGDISNLQGQINDKLATTQFNNVLNSIFPVGSVVITCDGSTHYLVNQYPSKFRELTDSDIAYLAIGNNNGNSNYYRLTREHLPNVNLSHSHSYDVYDRQNAQPWNYGTGGNVWNGFVTRNLRSGREEIYLNPNSQQDIIIKPKAYKLRMWKVISIIW